MEEDARATTLSELSSEIFFFVLGLRARADLVDFEVLHQGALRLFDEFEQKAKALRADPDEVSDARFALAAFVDEAVLRSEWPGKEQWADDPLQLQFFETYLAGEVFFERLDNLRAKEKTPREVLEIYLLCLLLGFKGKLGIAGAEQLKALVRALQDELGRSRSEELGELSPHWKVIDGPASTTSKLPRWLIYMCAAVMAVCLLVYVGFFISILIEAGEVQESLETALFLQTLGLNGTASC